MALREIQTFLTRYIRDPYFREKWKGQEQVSLCRELGLTAEDLDLIRQVPVDELDTAAHGIRTDRINKRRTEFSQFLDHLGLYVTVEDFLKAYDAAYTTGRESVPVELDWFLSFSMKFVSQNGLPDYLISLARFCHHYTRVAFLPLEFSDNTLVSPREKGVEAYHVVKLSSPFRVERFRYNVLEVALSEPLPGEVFIGEPTSLMFMKSREAFKRSLIWRLDDLPPYISMLIDEPKSLSDLIGMQTGSSYADIVEDLLNYHDIGVIDFVIPSYHQI